MKSQIRLFRIVLKGKVTRPRSLLNSAFAVSLLLLATAGCKMLNFKGSGQVNSSNSSSPNSEASSGISVPAGYEEFLPQQVGTFRLIRAFSTTPNPSDAELELVTGVYRSPNHPETSEGTYAGLSLQIEKYRSDIDADSAMANYMKEVTSKRSELMQYKLAGRAAGPNGEARVLLRNTDPENSKYETVVWVNGSYFFEINFGTIKGSYGIADEFANAYPK